MRTRSKPLERDLRVCEQRANPAKEIGEFENKEQTAQSETTELENTEHTARKGLKDFENNQQTARKGLENLRTRSKPHEKY